MVFIIRIIVVIGSCAFTLAAFANDYDTIKQLISSSSYHQALEGIRKLENEALDDVRLKFLEARVLTEIGEIDQAIELYQRLVVQQPESPELYINLSAVYAQQGNLELAREWALKGLRADGRYAKLYQNLVTIHGVLAARAYHLALDEPLNEVEGPALEISEELDIRE